MYYYYVFFSVCRAPNRAPMRVFFLRFVVHQIMLQCVLFLAVCRAPNRVLLCGSWPGVSFGKLLLVVSLSAIFHEGIDYW